MPDTPSHSAIERLVAQLSRLPGIGRRSAERVVFYLLKQPESESATLAAAITDLKHRVRHCSLCFNLSESDPCPICTDPRRDQTTILVVEQPTDLASIETTGLYRGVYHVLMGRLSPLDGVGPGELNIDTLLERVRSCHDEDPALSHPAVREVILGTNPNLEGDGTSLYLSEKLMKQGIRVTRLARGLPTGSSLELVSKAVLSDAIHGRQIVT